MDKSTKFGRYELTLVAVNSCIAKLFLIYPLVFIKNSGSASILVCIMVILIGYLISFLFYKLYDNFKSSDLLYTIQVNLGKTVKIIFAIILLLQFIYINGWLLQSMSESIKISLMPGTSTMAVKFTFLIGASFAAFVGLKSIVRSNAVIVPFIIAAIVIIALGNIGHLKFNNIYPIFGNGITSFTFGIIMANYFSDFLLLLFLTKYADTKINYKSIINRSYLISSIILLLVIGIYQLSNNYTIDTQVMPMYQIAQGFKIGSVSARLESIFSFAWFICYYLYLSLIIYICSKIVSDIVGKNIIKQSIIFIAFSIYLVSLISHNGYLILDMDMIGVIRGTFEILIPFILLFICNIKARRKKVEKD